MNYHGDIPEEHRQWMEELQEMEAHYTANMAVYPLDRIAQAYVCCAHDWYDLECEEDGERLLKLAEAVCPGYFLNYMPQHMMEDELYALLVNQLLEKVGQTLQILLDKK
jgi:hypothetical protein